MRNLLSSTILAMAFGLSTAFMTTKSSAQTLYDGSINTGASAVNDTLGFEWWWLLPLLAIPIIFFLMREKEEDERYDEYDEYAGRTRFIGVKGGKAGKKVDKDEEVL